MSQCFFLLEPSNQILPLFPVQWRHAAFLEVLIYHLEIPKSQNVPHALPAVRPKIGHRQ